MITLLAGATPLVVGSDCLEHMTFSESSSQLQTGSKLNRDATYGFSLLVHTLRRICADVLRLTSREYGTPDATLWKHQLTKLVRSPGSAFLL